MLESVSMVTSNETCDKRAVLRRYASGTLALENWGVLEDVLENCSTLLAKF